jgi:hypothetical protein
MNSALHSFAAWLASRLHLLEFPLRISPSRYVPGGVRADCTGLEQLAKCQGRWVEPQTSSVETTATPVSKKGKS